MSERIEWVEPEEAARERCEKRQAENNRIYHTHMRYCVILAVPAAIAIPLFSQRLGLEMGEALFDSLRLLVPSFALPIFLRLAFSFESKSAEQKLVLSSDTVDLWKHARSFEITDHPTLPGIRRLLVHRDTTPRQVQACFHISQLNEAELSTFIEARIAEQTAQRLMRRVKM